MARQITDLPKMEPNTLSNNDLMFLRDSSEHVDKKIKFEDIVKAIALSFYQVGDYFITKSNINPSERFGGSWEKVKGKFLVGVDEQNPLFNIVGATGGSESVVLTGDQLPRHGFDLQVHGDSGGAGNSGTVLNYLNPVGAMKRTASTRESQYRSGGGNIGGAGSQGRALLEIGANQAHSNLPPYEAVNIWRRIA